MVATDLQTPSIADNAERIEAANPWWHGAAEELAGADILAYRRGTTTLISSLTATPRPKVTLLSGPPGTGKSTALRQAASHLVEAGIAPRDIVYLPLAAPRFSNATPARLLTEALIGGRGAMRTPGFILLDDLHVVENWPLALHILDRARPGATIIATSALSLPDDTVAGSVAEIAFTPLTFAEYLRISGREAGLIGGGAGAVELPALNAAFGDYLNQGAFPGTLRTPSQSTLGDLVAAAVDGGTPATTGIHDTTDLKRAFALLARNAGREIAYEPLAQALDIAKNTLRKYLDHFAAAGLLHRLHRVDLYGKRMARATRFKVYPTAACLYAGLFGPAAASGAVAARLAEIALVNHLAPQATADGYFYADWSAAAQGGGSGVSLIGMSPGGDGGAPPRADAARAISTQPGGIASLPATREALVAFCHANRLDAAWVFDRWSHLRQTVDGVAITTTPIAWTCYLMSHFADPRLRPDSQTSPYGMKLIS